MWRRTYIFLVLVRLWFALSPSYLHPDENFQGPEVIAGMLLSRLPHTPHALLSSCNQPMTDFRGRAQLDCGIGVPEMLQLPTPAPMLTEPLLARSNLQLPSATDLGVHEREPRPKRVPSLAGLWPPYAFASVAMDRQWTRRRDTARGRLLGVAGADVHHKFRPGGLGNP